MHNLPKLVFDLVTGTFPDALFQHNWWVILMAVATPQNRTTIGRMSKNARLTFTKTVIVSMRTTGLGLGPEAIRDVVLKIGQNGTVEAPWAFLCFFRERLSRWKRLWFHEKLGDVWAVSDPVARAYHTFGKTTTGTSPNQQTSWGHDKSIRNIALIKRLKESEPIKSLETLHALHVSQRYHDLVGSPLHGLDRATKQKHEIYKAQFDSFQVPRMCLSNAGIYTPFSSENVDV